MTQILATFRAGLLLLAREMYSYSVRVALACTTASEHLSDTLVISSGGEHNTRLSQKIYFPLISLLLTNALEDINNSGEVRAVLQYVQHRGQPAP